MERKQINNAFYETLQDKWFWETAHPIALLRAENAIRNPWILETIQRRFSGPCKVLDVGCGAGFLTHPLSLAGHAVTGVDLSPSTLQAARSSDSTDRVEYLEAAAESLPFENETFDVVCAMDLLEHVERPQKVIQEASRVLKSSGLFFFHTFNRTFWSWLLVIKGVEWGVKNTPPNMHVYRLFITPKELQQICQSSHLEVSLLRGLRPIFTPSHLAHFLFKGAVPEDFSFAFTPSLKTGYLGFATKQ